MLQPQELERQLLEHLSAELAGYGYVLRRGVLQRPRNSIVSDCILCTRTLRDNLGPLFVSVNLGIHCIPLHELTSTLGETIYSRAIPTFSLNIGHLLPRAKFKDWRFNRDKFHPEEAELLVASIAHVGLEYQGQYTDLATVEQGCEQYGLAKNNYISMPVLSYLNGDFKRAVDQLSVGIKALSEREDSEAQHFRLLAKGLLDLCRQGKSAAT